MIYYLVSIMTSDLKENIVEEKQQQESFLKNQLREQKTASSTESKPKGVDESTINFKTREPPHSQRRDEGRFSINLHVRNSKQEIMNMIIPRGIGVKIHGRNINDDFTMEGSLITAYCNNITPTTLCSRELEELEEFVKTKFRIINDNPSQLKQYGTEKQKIETEIVNDTIADKAFNFYKLNNKIFGEL